MYCDEKKVKEILTQMTRLYNELQETNVTIDEQQQKLSALTVSRIDTNINEINPKIESALERFRILITEIETKASSIMALNNLKGDTIIKNLPASSTLSVSATTSRFTMEVTEKEALNAITTNLNNNREITKFLNAEIGKEKAVLR